MRILLVEDNVRAGPLLREYLDDAGFTVDLAASLSEFEEMAKTFRYALYVVDLGLPDGDGRQIISLLRAAKQASPIIVTSARAQVSERVSSLDCGADDYLVKPFHHSELLARIRALLRRTPHSGSLRLEAGTLVAGNLVLDRSNGEITCQGRRITIRPRERRLLTLLMLRAEQPVPKDTIENVVMGEDQEVTPNAVEKVVSRLRATLAEQQARLRIKTIRGLGYMLLKHPTCSAIDSL